MPPLRPLTSCLLAHASVLRRHASSTATITTPPQFSRRRIKIFPPIPGPPTKDPIPHLTRAQLSVLDPAGARAAQFSRKNRSAIRPGDILYVRRKNGEPFSGVLIDIRRRGVDTAILLRDHLTKVGVEMWIKVFSPIVESVNLVQRRAKRSRRAKLYYMRKPKHDYGPVRGIVTDWLRKSYALARKAASQKQAHADALAKQQKKGKKQ